MLDLQDAISLLEEGESRQASVLLEEMAAEMPGYATARVLLARAYEGLGEWGLALAAWRDALQIIPNSPVIRRGLSRAARKVATKSPIDRPAEEAPSGEPTTAEESVPHGPSVEPPLVVEVPDDEDEPADAAHADSEPADSEPAEPAPDTAAADPGDTAPADPADAKPADSTAAGSDEAAAEPDEPSDAESEPPAAAEPGDRAPSELRESEPAERAAAEFEDLDRLISELESARIIPRPDLDDLPSPELEDDIEDVVSETLARIYASQGQYDEAARVYELLADQQPMKADEFMDKASEMRSRASDQE